MDSSIKPFASTPWILPSNPLRRATEGTREYLRGRDVRGDFSYLKDDAGNWRPPNDPAVLGTVRVFRQGFTLEYAIGFPCLYSLEALTCV